MTPRIALFVVALTRAAEFDNSAAFSTRAEIEALLDSVWAISNAHATAVLAGLAYNASDGVGAAADVRRLLFALQKGSDSSIYMQYWGLEEDGQFIGCFNRGALGGTDAYAVTHASGDSASAGWDGETGANCQDHGLNMSNCRNYWTADNVTGAPDELLEEMVRFYDPRLRPWYRYGRNAKSWTEIYVGASGGGLMTTAAQPLRDRAGRFVGVTGIDYSFATIANSLASTALESASVDLVILVVDESSGNLIATSAGANYSYTSTPDGTGMEQVRAVDASDNITRAAARFFDSGTYEDSQVYVHDHRYLMASAFTDVTRSLKWTLIISQLMDCRAGEFEDAVQIMCSSCTIPSTSTAGATSCDMCIEGYWWDASAGGCRVCLEGASCPGGREFTVDRGYWRTESDSVTLFECPMKQGCAGDDQCSDGYEGIKCGVCANGYFWSKFTGRCLECTASALGITITVLLFGITVLAVAILRMLVVRKKLASLVRYWDVNKFKIMWSTFQLVNSVEWSLELRFPEPFNTFTTATSMMTEATLSQILPLSCAIDGYDHYTHLLVVTLVPLGLIGGFAAGATVYSRRDQPEKSHDLFSAALLVSFMILPTTSTAIFQTFHCDNTLDDGKSFLVVDVSIGCNTQRHDFFQVYAVLFAFIFPIGACSRRCLRLCVRGTIRATSCRLGQSRSSSAL